MARTNGHGGANDLQFRVDHRLQRGRRGRRRTSVFREFLGFCDEVLAALDVLAAHDHPDAGTINQGGSVSGHRPRPGNREKLGQITT